MAKIQWRPEVNVLTVPQSYKIRFVPPRLSRIAGSGAGSVLRAVGGCVGCERGSVIEGFASAFNGRMTMPTKSKSRITTERAVGRRLPKKCPPTHLGEMLAEEFLKPLALTRTELSRHLDIPYSRLNNIIKGKSALTPDTALRLSQVVGMSADFWLGLQQDWDLWQAMHRPEARAIFRLKPLVATGKSISA